MHMRAGRWGQRCLLRLHALAAKLIVGSGCEATVKQSQTSVLTIACELQASADEAAGLLARLCALRQPLLLRHAMDMPAALPGPPVALPASTLVNW